MLKGSTINKSIQPIQIETFVAKPRYGSNPRFDPMMKEREGWTIGEATRNDVEDTIALHNALMLFPFRATLYLGPN